MRHGKKPTREQRNFLIKHKMETFDCLVIMDTPTEMVVVYKGQENVPIKISKVSG